MNVTKRLILASQSPRRLALLRQIGLQVEVIPSCVREDFDPTVSPEDNTKSLAHAKAIDVGRNIEEAIIIGADTIVEVDSILLPKPATPSDAVRMLEMLSGRTHTVHTGFALLDRPSNKYVAEVESTRVTFRPIPPAEIEEYVAGGSPMDKAGAYGIQDDYGAVFVSGIDGCFYNVVGFPLSKFYTTLQQFQSELMKVQGC